MMDQVENVCEEEDFDIGVLMPIAILHDIGYSEVGKVNPSVKDQNIKKLHMEKGAEISQKLLMQLNFDGKTIEEVSYLISAHDNWVFGDNKVFHKISEMAVFNDLDFIWPFSSIKQFKITAESMEMNSKEAYKFWENDEKFINRPLCCEYTKKLYKKLSDDIKKAL